MKGLIDLPMPLVLNAFALGFDISQEVSMDQTLLLPSGYFVKKVRLGLPQVMRYYFHRVAVLFGGPLVAFGRMNKLSHAPWVEMLG